MSISHRKNESKMSHHAENILDESRDISNLPKTAHVYDLNPIVRPPVKRPTAPKSTIKQTPYKDTEGETVSSIEIAEMGILETEMSYVHPTIDRLREDI